jgi:hypothetical protein
MDKEQIRKALDHFENDEYTDAEEILSQEIRDAKEKFIEDKIGLEEGWKKKKMMEQDDDEEEDMKKKKKMNGDEEEEEEE